MNSKHLVPANMRHTHTSLWPRERTHFFSAPFCLSLSYTLAFFFPPHFSFSHTTWDVDAASVISAFIYLSFSFSSTCYPVFSPCIYILLHPQPQRPNLVSTFLCWLYTPSICPPPSPPPPLQSSLKVIPPASPCPGGEKTWRDRQNERGRERNEMGGRRDQDMIGLEEPPWCQKIHL